MIKKFFTAVIALSFAATACVGCGINSSSTQHLSDGGDVTISWWTFPVFSQLNSNDPAGTYEQSIIDAFEDLHPDIHVELKTINFTTGPDKISAAIKSGTMGDVLFDAPGRIISYGEAGYLATLGDMFTQDFVKDVDNDHLISACSLNDTPYMYPISSSPFYMAFNKEMAEAAGVEKYIHEGWTTDDFVKTITGLRDAGYAPGSVYYNGTGGDQGTRAFAANLHSGSIINNTLDAYTVNEAPMISGLSDIQEWCTSGLIADGEYNNGSSDIADFVSGKTSFTLLWSTGQQTSNADELAAGNINVIQVPFPSDDGQPELEYLVNGFCVFDNGDERRIEASKELIQFICDDPVYGPESVVRTGCFPVRTSYGQLYSDDTMQLISTWTRYYGIYYNTVAGFSDMRKSWAQLLLNLLYTGKDPKYLADCFNNTANALLN